MDRMENQTNRRVYSRSRTAAFMKKLKIDSDDSAKYALFLKNPNSGIIKLLAQSNCDKNKKNVFSKCSLENAAIKDYAAAYSFIEQRHTNKFTGDISLTHNNLDATTTRIQTIIVDLGDEPLDTLTLESKGAAYLKKFMPASQLSQARKQYDNFLKSVKVEHFIYSKSVPVALNHTYVVRSIDYQDSTIIPGKEYLDTIVAVKIIRLDEDGNVTLLWKELSRKNAPVLLIGT